MDRRQSTRWLWRPSSSSKVASRGDRTGWSGTRSVVCWPFEAGRLLRESGEEVRFLGLIDAIYDRRYWPASTYLMAIARRTGRHLSGLIRKPPSEALLEFRTRAGRLWATTDGPHGALGHQTSNGVALTASRPTLPPWPIGVPVPLRVPSCYSRPAARRISAVTRLACGDHGQTP